MRRTVFFLLAIVALGGVLAYTAPISGQGAGEAAPIYDIKIPAGYRDWRLISVAHEEGNLNDLRAQLGNDVAIKAFREGKLPFPDGTIIAALHWNYVSSEENNKVFGRVQSFVAGSPKNIQFMIKDSKKYLGRAAGGSLTLRPANLRTRRYTKLASPATNPQRLATLSTPVTRHNTDDRSWHAKSGCEQSQQSRAPYSMTSSAATSSVAGASSPSILAVSALMTSSNLVACTTGKSAGLTPLRMRPV